MKKPTLAMELCVMACGAIPLGVISALFWLVQGKVPRVLVDALLAVFVGCTIGAIVERIAYTYKESESGKD